MCRTTFILKTTRGVIERRCVDRKEELSFEGRPSFRRWLKAKWKVTIPTGLLTIVSLAGTAKGLLEVFFKSAANGQTPKVEKAGSALKAAGQAIAATPSDPFLNFY